jgi:DNA-binding MarR family transcriptional regulator
VSKTPDIHRTEVSRAVKAARKIDAREASAPAVAPARVRTPVAEIPEQAARLRMAIARTARRLRQTASQSTDSELGASSIAALATIERAGPLTPSELADAERVKRPTVTRIVARLADEGMVERGPDPEDGRRSLISITPSGKDLLKRLRNRKDAYLAQRLADLSERDVATLRRAAAILERMLEEERA